MCKRPIYKKKTTKLHRARKRRNDSNPSNQIKKYMPSIVGFYNSKVGRRHALSSGKTNSDKARSKRRVARGQDQGVGNIAHNERVMVPNETETEITRKSITWLPYTSSQCWWPTQG